ncbi:hypothetical protein [Thermosporothrix hazakensis]|jgi:hypothetical protein|nr:hypothetical protein [Thermosporothrix hazakensis]
MSEIALTDRAGAVVFVEGLMSSEWLYNVINDSTPVREFGLYLACADELLDKVSKWGIPGAQIGKQPLAADPPAPAKLVMIVQEVVEPDMHHQERRQGIIVQVPFGFIVAMKDHEVQHLQFIVTYLFGLRLSCLLL